MFYLVLQTSVLLSISAVVFFAMGWMVRRWMEPRWQFPSRQPEADKGESEDNPWRPPVNLPRPAPSSESVVESEAPKPVTMPEPIPELISVVEERVKDLGPDYRAEIEILQQKLVERDLDLEQARQSSQSLEQRWLQASQHIVELEQAAAMHGQQLEVLKQAVAASEAALTELNAQSAPNEGIAAALREQLKNFEEQNGQLRVEIIRLQQHVSEKEFELQHWRRQAEELERKLSAPSKEPLIELQPIAEAIAPFDSSEILERVEKLEKQLGQQEEVLLQKDESMELELKSRLLSLEETIQNLKAESEMALLAQLEFQNRTKESEVEDRHRWEDLENELELRISQLERELSGVRQADELVGRIGEQVEEHLKEQISSLAHEVSAIKESWTHQEEEFKTRDQQILGNLDRLQESLQKLGIRIEEDASVPDSVLKEMDELRGDILASVPELDGMDASALLESAPENTGAEEVARVRARFEDASENLQQLLQEKDRKIRELDQKLQAMAKKLDPSLVGKDDLQLIKGIGPYIQRILEKEFGISSFKQVALLTKDQVEAISDRLFFKNKVEKEDWIGQAMELHLKKYDERLEHPQPPYRFQRVG